MPKLKLSTLYKAANYLSVNPAFIFWSIRDVPGKRGVWMRKEDDLGGQPFRPQSPSLPPSPQKVLFAKLPSKVLAIGMDRKTGKLVWDKAEILTYEITRKTTSHHVKQILFTIRVQ